MIVAFELYHESTGWFSISEPDGWPDAKLGFERHEDAFHCLVEYYRSTFRLYGSNGEDEGGRDQIKQIEKDFGLSSRLKIRVKIKDTEFDEFEIFYLGSIPIKSLVETIDNDHTITFTPEPDDVWAKLISELDTPVNIQSAQSKNGVDVDVIPPFDVRMTPQALDQSLHIRQNNGVNTGTIYEDTFTSPDFQDDLSENQYAQVNLDDEVLTELQTYYAPFFSATADEISIAEFMAPNFKGVADFDIKISAAIFYFNGPPGGDTDKDKIWWNFSGVGTTYGLSMYLKIGDEIIGMTRTDKSRTFTVPPLAYDQTNEWSEFTQTISRDIPAGTPIKIYCRNTGSVPYGYGNNTFDILQQQIVILGDQGNNIEMQPAVEDAHPGEFIQGPTKLLLKDFGTPDGVESYIKITQATIMDETRAPWFLIHDIARSVLDRICDQNNTLVSEYLGNQSTTPSYENTGCGSNNMGTQGLQVRGWTLDEKQMALSFKKVWEGINPALNLALWPVRDSVTGKLSIHIGKKSELYRTDAPAVYISNVRKISKDYDDDHIYKNYVTGYRQWESEDISGIDDPQTTQTRSNNLYGVDNDFEQISDWVAASYAIETTRRASKEKSKDYKFDNDIFLLAVSPDGEGGFVPELDENLTYVDGLRNASTRYNIRHTPGHMFLRWMDYIAGALQTNPGPGLTFQSAEGNYDVTTNFEPGDCDDYNVPLSEKANMVIPNDFLFIPRLFKFETAITLAQFKAIRENQGQAIMVSQTNVGHFPMFIKDLEFTPYTGECTIRGWAKEWIDLQVIQDDEDESMDIPCTFDKTFDFTFC